MPNPVDDYKELMSKDQEKQEQPQEQPGAAEAEAALGTRDVDTLKVNAMLLDLV